MGLENATYIDGLNASNPVGNADDISQGDDHLRLIKAVLKNTFPGLNKATYLQIASTNVASSATTNIGSAASDNLRITGTTTITSFGTAAAGIRRFLRFAGSLTLTHSSSLMLPSGANIVTAEDDTACMLSLGSGNWIALFYEKANGKALVAPAISEIANLSSRLEMLEQFSHVGTMMDYAGTEDSIENGWLPCDGRAVSRTTYSELFSKLSTTYGTGDGTTTFNIPDCRGRVSAGKDDMGGVGANRLTDQDGGIDGSTLGAVGGEETHKLTVDELALHGHQFRTGADDGNINFSGGMAMEGTNQVNHPAYTGTPSSDPGKQIGGAGGDEPHNNVQPTIIFNKIIWTGVLQEE
jgi:microcystin-dependent protein